jgi:hypothetical protein
MVDYIIIIIALVNFTTLAVTFSIFKGSRGFINYRGYQLLTTGLVEDEDHVDESNVCHELNHLFPGYYIIILTLILIVVCIYLRRNIRAPEEKVLLDAALLGDKGSEIRPEADD